MRIDRYGLVVLAALCAASCGDDDTVLVVFDAGADAGADAGHATRDAGAENDAGAEEDGGVTPSR